MMKEETSLRKMSRVGPGMYVIIALFAMIFCVLVAAQETKAPAIPESVKVKILKIQLQQAQLSSEFTQLQTRMNDIQKQYQASNTSLQEAQEEAYKEARVNRKDWSIDMKEVTFVAVPKTEVKKEEGKK